MKKKIILPIVLTGVLALAATAFGADKNIQLNGEAISDSTVIEADGHTLFPVRTVAEALGLSVEWEGTTKTVIVTNGGPLYVTFSIGVDGYTFAKTAPMPLGCAPVISEGRTYIPVEAITELLGLEVSENDEAVNIITMTESTEETTEVVSEEEPTTDDVVVEESTEASTEVLPEGVNEVIGKVVEVKDEGEILFSDEEKGEILLIPADDASIAFDDGSEATVADIKADDMLTVVYGDIMTMSIPPVNNPVSITIIRNEP